jgi:two-component system NarL family response regulator
MTIKVAIVEDQRMMRELLAAVLSRENDIRIVAEASSGAEAIGIMREQMPDVILLDIGLPDLNGIAVARALRELSSAVKIVALSAYSERAWVNGMLEAGAMGYVAKSAASQEVLLAIRAVCEGKIYLSSGLASLPANAGDDLRITRLGHREREVLTRLAAGMRSADIAKALTISIATVEVHRRNIMRKLGLHTVAELTRYAIRNGLIPP